MSQLGLVNKLLLQAGANSHFGVAIEFVSSWLRLEDNGLFPKRLKLGNGGKNAKAFWVEREVLDYIQTYIDRRDHTSDTP